MITSKVNYENTSFQDFERVVIYDVKDGKPELLVSSMKELLSIVSELPADRDTRAMWLYDKDKTGPRLGMLYWVLWDDEKPDPGSKLVTRNISTASERYSGLTVITCTCVTDVADGSIGVLLENALKEVQKLKIQKLEDISFSKIGVDNFMDRSILKMLHKPA
jgi:hypothetical protein